MPKKAFITVPDTYEMPDLGYINPEIWPVMIQQTIEILNLQSVKQAYKGENFNTDESGRIKIADLLKENKEISVKLEEINNNFDKNVNERVKEIKEKYLEMIKENEDMARLEIKKERDAYKKNIDEAVELEKNRYKHLQNIYQQDQQEYNNKINIIKLELKDEKDQAKKKYQERLETYKISFQEEIKRLNDIIINDKKEFVEEKKVLNNKIMVLEEQILQALNNNNNAVQQFINENISRHTLDLSSQIKLISDPILKFYGGTNMEKGNLGECFVENLLKDNTFSDAIIEDVSGQTGAGDRLFKWRKLKCLIEVKNKRKLTRDDLEKFTRDVATSAESLRANCGLFISLLTNEYPGRSRELIQVDYVGTIPVIFIYVTNQNQIIYALACLEKLVIADKSDHTQDIKMLANYYVNYRTSISESQKNIDKMIQIRERELKYLRKELENYNNILDDLEKNYPSVAKFIDTAPPEIDSRDTQAPIIAFDKTDPAAKNKLLDIIINNLLTNKSITITDLIKQLGITREYFEQLGGYKNLVRDAKIKYLSDQINDTIINKIIEYKNKNNSFPSREMLIKLKIIPERDYKKLNKVLKVKKLIDVINEVARQKEAAK